MDSQTPIKNATCAQGGSLRVAILLMAMFGFMTLWSNMRDELPDCDVSLSSKLRMKPEEARSRLFAASRHLRAEYRPMFNAISHNLGQMNDYLAEIHQRVKLRREARCHQKPISVAAIRSLRKLDYERMQAVAMKLINDAEQRMQTIAVDSMQKLIHETGYRVEFIRLERRISDLSNGEQTTR